MKKFTSTYWLLDYVIDPDPPRWKKLLVVTLLGAITIAGVYDRGATSVICFKSGRR